MKAFYYNSCYLIKDVDDQKTTGEFLIHLSKFDQETITTKIKITFEFISEFVEYKNITHFNCRAIHNHLCELDGIVDRKNRVEVAEFET